MSVQKFDMWLEEKTMLAEVLSKRSIKWVTRRKMSELNRRLYTSMETDNGRHASILGGAMRPQGEPVAEMATTEVARIALDLCVMRGAVVHSVDEVNSSGEPPIVTAAGNRTGTAVAIVAINGVHVGGATNRNGSTQPHGIRKR